MNNLLRILALEEKDMHRVSFVRAREEGGINILWDPFSARENHQVFIHSQLPYKELARWDFENFAAARSFAARQFSDWEVLTWDLKTKRPCEDGGKECGSGECDTCVSVKKEAAANGETIEPGCGSCGGA